jgi:O-6-methylguanine DNA methyltransferase
MSKNNTFVERVRAIVKKIPKGKVMTYGEVASKAGSPRAYRAVASIMAKNFDTTVPCHRVVRADGSLGGYNRGGTMKKRALLLSEGVQL